MSDAGPRLSRYGPAARAEFRRVLLDSLIASATSELEFRQSRRQRLRARSAQRRLDELTRQRRELDAERFTRQPVRWIRAAATGYLVSAIWLAGAALLALELTIHGVHTRLTIVGDLAMLAWSLLWFLLAVARVPLRQPEDDDRESPAAPPA